MSQEVPQEDEEAMLERYRQMDPVEKLRLVFEMSAAAWNQKYDEVRARYGPDISDREVMLRAAAQVYLKEKVEEDRTGLEEIFRQIFKNEGFDFPEELRVEQAPSSELP